MPKAPKGIPREHPNAASSHMGDRCVAATSLRCCGGTPGDQDGRGTNELSKIESILGTRMSQNLSRDRRLACYFSHQQGQVPDPDAVLRVYHDTAQVEVVDLRQSALPLVAGYHYPSLLNKWKVQLFLSKCRATSSNLGAAGACSENHREYIHVGSASASLPPKFSDQAPAPLFNSLRPWMTSSCVEMACLLPAPGTPFQRGKGIVD